MDARQALRDSLLQGVEGGESIPELASRVSEVFADATGRRATIIARTEVLQSSNFATYEAQKQSGVVDTRKWLVTRDDRTRDSHMDMDGQERAINAPFTLVSGPNVGATAEYPGSFGIPEEDIQCRCTTIAVIKSGESDSKDYTPEQLDALWKQFDRRLIPWERRVMAGLKRGSRLSKVTSCRF